MKCRQPISAAQRKAINTEINRQIAENVGGLSVYIQAVVLWQLREQLGWGKKRLLRFQKRFAPALKELQEYYEMKTDSDTQFLCEHKLKQEVGIDVRELDEMFKVKYRIDGGKEK